MKRISEKKIILVTKRSRLEELVVRYNTMDQARFYIEHLGADFSDYILEDKTYRQAVVQARSILENMGRVQELDREYVPNFIFGQEDIVVVVGQDGLVANTLKYLEDQPLIGVNPDPRRWDGVLLPFRADDLRLLIPEVLQGRRPVKQVTMARAALNDGQVLHAVNDLFIGQKSHVSSRYHLRLGQREESQSSSGIIVSTGLGATGWLKSILTGAANIVSHSSGMQINPSTDQQMDWGARYLYYSVREPFPSRASQANMVFGKIGADESLHIVSQMPENGVIFSDGIESDFLQFNSGVQATINVSEKTGHLVV